MCSAKSDLSPVEYANTYGHSTGVECVTNKKYSIFFCNKTNTFFVYNEKNYKQIHERFGGKVLRDFKDKHGNRLIYGCILRTPYLHKVYSYDINDPIVCDFNEYEPCYNGFRVFVPMDRDVLINNGDWPILITDGVSPVARACNLSNFFDSIIMKLYYAPHRKESVVCATPSVRAVPECFMEEVENPDFYYDYDNSQFLIGAKFTYLILTQTSFISMPDFVPNGMICYRKTKEQFERLDVRDDNLFWWTLGVYHMNNVPYFGMANINDPIPEGMLEDTKMLQRLVGPDIGIWSPTEYVKRDAADRWHRFTLLDGYRGIAV